MTDFNPLTATIGGILIGCAASLLLYLNGKIMGISGILARALFFRKHKSLWEFFFIAGIISGAGLMRLLTKDSLTPTITSNSNLIILGGLLVGIGTHLGSGCTSGHGICGIARLSKRSITATILFMLSAMLTVFILKTFGILQ